jgi:hypothetical protein
MSVFTRGCTIIVAAFASGLSSPALGALVLALSSGNAAEDAAVVSVLESHGHSVDLGPQYTGFNGSLSLAGYDSVLLLANYNWPAGNMPAAGQTALVNFVSGGGGLVTGEWTVWKSAAQVGVFQTLDDAIPVVPTGLFRTAIGPTVYTQSTPDPILNAGVPATFSFVADNIGGTETQFNPRPGATVFYTSNYPAAGVIGWDYGLGRTISFSTVIGPLELADPNYSRLLSNAVTWSVAAIPEPSAALFMGASACFVIAIGAVHHWRTRKLCACTVMLRSKENLPTR